MDDNENYPQKGQVTRASAFPTRPPSQVFYLFIPVSSDMVSFDCCRVSYVGASTLSTCFRSRKLDRFTDWFFFLVLDIGNKELAYLPVGVKFIVGLLQATAVRAAGFATVSIMALAPAVKCVFWLAVHIYY